MDELKSLDALCLLPVNMHLGRDIVNTHDKSNDMDDITSINSSWTIKKAQPAAMLIVLL